MPLDHSLNFCETGRAGLARVLLPYRILVEGPQDNLNTTNNSATEMGSAGCECQGGAVTQVLGEVLDMLGGEGACLRLTPCPGRSYSFAPSETVLCLPHPHLACWGQSSSCLAESYTSPLCWNCLQRRGSGGFSCLHVPHQYRLQCLEARGKTTLINSNIPGQLQSHKVYKQTLFSPHCAGQQLHSRHGQA